MPLRIVRLLAVGVGMVVAATIVLISLDRRTYFTYRHEYPALWEHPTSVVVLVAVATLAEAGLVAFVFGTTLMGRLWRRGLVALLLLVPWGCLVSTFVIHSPGFWMLHVAWVWLLIALLSAVTLASGAFHGYSLMRVR